MSDKIHALLTLSLCVMALVFLLIAAITGIKIVLFIALGFGFVAAMSLLAFCFKVVDEISR